MSDLLHETTPPLAWNDEEQPFLPPETAIAWRVRRYSGKPGRPPAVWTANGILHIGLDATLEHLRIAVRNQPGSYRLYPVDKDGRELGPVACIELIQEEDELDNEIPSTQALAQLGSQGIAQPAAPSNSFGAETAARFFDLYERMLTSRDAHDAMLANVLTTLVTTTANIQQSTANLLAAATTTIKVANGIEAIERQEPPQLDIQELTEQLSTALTTTTTSETAPAAPWFVQVLNGPVGMGLMQLAKGFMSTIAAAQSGAGASSPAASPAAAMPAAPPVPPAPAAPARAAQPTAPAQQQAAAPQPPAAPVASMATSARAVTARPPETAARPIATRAPRIEAEDDAPLPAYMPAAERTRERASTRQTDIAATDEDIETAGMDIEPTDSADADDEPAGMDIALPHREHEPPHDQEDAHEASPADWEPNPTRTSATKESRHDPDSAAQ